jgi:hypothetical protein
MYGASYMSASADPVIYVQTMGEDNLTLEHLTFWQESLVDESNPQELDRKQAHVTAITEVLTAKGII